MSLASTSVKAQQAMLCLQLLQAAQPYAKQVIDKIVDPDDRAATMAHIKDFVGDAWDVVKFPAVGLYNLIHDESDESETEA